MLTSFTEEELEMFPASAELPRAISFGHYWHHWSFDISLRSLFLKDSEWENAYSVQNDLFRKLMSKEITQEEFTAKNDDFLNHPERYPEVYGVCDNPAQVVANWPCLLLDDLQHMISFSEVRREDQSADGGWRWHKWGTYIGNQEQTHEYLYYETHIEKIYTFKIYTFKDETR